MNPRHFLITKIWDVLNVNANRLKLSSRKYKDVRIANFCWSNWKITRVGKTSRKKQSHGPMTWKDMPGNALRDTVIWQTKKWSNYTKFQIFVWMTINSNRKNLNQWEDYHKYDHKLSWNACSWHELGDQTFHGLSKKWQEQSQNGLRHVTDDWQEWFHTFTTQVTTDNVVMWVTRLSIVDWVRSKTQTLLATLKIRNQPREESYVSLEAEHLCPSVGCARYKRQYPTVLQKCWTANGWTTCPRSLGRGNWGVEFNKQH